MSIFRVKKKEKNFSILYNSPFQNEKLSLEARGMLAYLLTKPANWEVINNDLYTCSPAGRNKIDRVIRELKGAGHIKRFREQQPNGRFTWVSEVYELPIAIPPKTNDGSTNDGSTNDGSTNDGKPNDIINTDLPNTELQSIDPQNTEQNPFSDSGESEQPSGGSSSQEENKPETGEAATRNEPELRPLNTPFGIFQRLAEIDPSIAGKRGQVLRDVKDLLNGNNGRCITTYTPEDILNCAKFVVQDPWRIKNLVPLTSQVLVEKLPKWVEAKRPKTWNEWESSQTSTQNGVAKFHRDRTHELVTEEKFG